MAVDFEHIPIVDIDSVRLTLPWNEVAKNTLQPLADELCHNLKTVGFVYLKNHGISQEKVRQANKKCI